MTEIVHNEQDFLKYRGLGEEDFEEVSRSTYKHTHCGAFIDRTESGYAIGSIVEGVDYGTETHLLDFPFTIQSYWETLNLVEEEATEIWNDTHGCDDCNPELLGRWLPINPDCKTCNGEGVII